MDGQLQRILHSNLDLIDQHMANNEDKMGALEEYLELRAKQINKLQSCFLSELEDMKIHHHKQQVLKGYLQQLSGQINRFRTTVNDLKLAVSQILGSYFDQVVTKSLQKQLIPHVANLTKTLRAQQQQRRSQQLQAYQEEISKLRKMISHLQRELKKKASNEEASHASSTHALANSLAGSQSRQSKDFLKRSDAQQPRDVSHGSIHKNSSQQVAQSPSRPTSRIVKQNSNSKSTSNINPRLLDNSRNMKDSSPIRQFNAGLPPDIPKGVSKVLTNAYYCVKNQQTPTLSKQNSQATPHKECKEQGSNSKVNRHWESQYYANQNSLSGKKTQSQDSPGTLTPKYPIYQLNRNQTSTSTHLPNHSPLKSGTLHVPQLPQLSIRHLTFTPPIINGFDVLQINGKQVYKGTWKKGLFEGRGKLYTDHWVYDGEFKGGVIDGLGSLHFKDYTFIGRFNHWNANGEGTLYTRDKQISGVWKDNQFLKPI